MTRMIQALAALALALGLAVPSTGMAQGMEDKGFYIGATIGQSKVKDFCGGVGASCEDTDTALRLLGGYQFNKNFALELGYHQLGEASISGAGLFAKVEATAWEAVAVGMFPVADRFSIYGKVGMYRADSDFSTNIVLPGIPQSFSESNNDLTFGFGLQFDITRNLGVRAEWQRYQDLGGPQIGESDLDVMSIGVVYRFR
jgi:OmpA-OmpF porin, OOP family